MISECIAAHKIVEVPLMEAFINFDNTYIISLLGAFLNSTILLDNERIYLKRYSIIKDDHLHDTKRRFSYILKRILINNCTLKLDSHILRKFLPN